MIESIPVTDPVKLHSQMRDGRPIHLVDVRSPAEYADGHAAGAWSIPIDELDAAQLKSRLGKRCRFGGTAPSDLHQRSACSAGGTQAAGAGSAQSGVVEGGTEAWSQQRLPLQRATAGVSLARQTQIALGMLIVLMLAKGVLLHPVFYALTGLLGIGLIVSGVTARCGLTALLAKMPWNRDPLGGSASSA